MPHTPPPFLERLKSAHLVRVLLLYAGASWAVIQVLDILDHFGLPDWFFFSGTLLLLIGFPVVVGTALLQGGLRGPNGDAGALSPRGREPVLWHLLRRWATWPRAILGGALTFALLMVAALAHAALRAPDSGLDRERIAVLPFRAVGPGAGLWGEGMVDLLSSAIDGTGAVSSVDPRAVMVRWREVVGEADAAGTREDAASVASRLGSGRMITGSLLVTSPGRVRLMGDLFDVTRLNKEASASIEGPESEMISLVDRLAIQLLKGLLGDGEVPDVRVSAIATRSVPALRAYLEGVHAFRQSRFDLSRAAFERAVELDSTFAIAAYGLSRASGWSDMEETSQRAILLAARHTGGLPERDSLLIMGLKMMESDADPASIELYEELTRFYPEDFEAWNGLAEAVFHHGHEVGYHLDRAIDALEHAYAIDSTVAPAFFHGIQSAFILDDTLRARRWSAVYLSLDSASVFARGLRLALALRLGPERDRRRAESALDTVAGDVLDRVLWFAPPGRSSMAYAELVLRAAAGPRFSQTARAGALRRLASEHLRHGQIGAWEAAEDEAAALGDGGHDLFALTALRVAGLLDDSAALRLGDGAWEATSYSEAATILAVAWAQEGRLGEVERAVAWLERAADSLASAGDSAGARDRRGAATAFRGDLALARSDTAAAIDHLRRGVAMMKPDWGGPRGLHRFVLAGLLRATGADTEAIRIYRALRRPAALEAFAYLQAARLHERRGEAEDAGRYYTWFLELWGDADSNLASHVESALEARDQLVVERGGA